MMGNSRSTPATGLFDAVRPRLAGCLASEAAVERVRAICARLPETAANCLEVRLGPGAERVDYSWHGYARPKGGQWAAALEEVSGAAWERVGAYLHGLDWESGVVESLWFEFDLESGASALPVPGVFFGYGAEAGSGEWRRAAAECAGFGEPLLDAIVPQLDIVRRHAEVAFFGLMLSRPEKALRLVLRGSAAAFRACLEELGWPGDFARLDCLLAEGEGISTRALWHLDLGPGILPRIGREFFFDRTPGQSGNPMRPILSRWTTAGWCSEEKAEAILAWEGTVREKTAGALWPIHLVEAAPRKTAAGGELFLTCYINHLKLTLGAKGPPEAKGYLFYHERALCRDDHATALAGRLYPGTPTGQV